MRRRLKSLTSIGHSRSAQSQYEQHSEYTPRFIDFIPHVRESIFIISQFIHSREKQQQNNDGLEALKEQKATWLSTLDVVVCDTVVCKKQKPSEKWYIADEDESEEIEISIVTIVPHSITTLHRVYFTSSAIHWIGFPPTSASDAKLGISLVLSEKYDRKWLVVQDIDQGGIAFQSNKLHVNDVVVAFNSIALYGYSVSEFLELVSIYREKHRSSVITISLGVVSDEMMLATTTTENERTSIDMDTSDVTSVHVRTRIRIRENEPEQSDKVSDENEDKILTSPHSDSLSETAHTQCSPPTPLLHPPPSTLPNPNNCANDMTIYGNRRLVRSRTMPYRSHSNTKADDLNQEFDQFLTHRLSAHSHTLGLGMSGIDNQRDHEHDLSGSTSVDTGAGNGKTEKIKAIRSSEL